MRPLPAWRGASTASRLDSEPHGCFRCPLRSQSHWLWRPGCHACTPHLGWPTHDHGGPLKESVTQTQHHRRGARQPTLPMRHPRAPGPPQEGRGSPKLLAVSQEFLRPGPSELHTGELKSPAPGSGGPCRSGFHKSTVYMELTLTESCGLESLLPDRSRWMQLP